jgi:hypothetical protein
MHTYLDKAGALNLALREYLNFLDFMKVFLIVSRSGLFLSFGLLSLLV